MRGKGSSPIACKFAVGITPAYAGKSGAIVFGAFKLRDHPRLCGEKTYRYVWRLKGTGSPPPMRGKGRCIFPLSVSKGITPAYAGKSYMENAGMTDAMRITPAYAGKR